MASVHIEFTPPYEPDLIKLLIYQSDNPDDGFVLLETVTDIGTFPSYISEYTSNVATSPVWWFSVAWEDIKGAKTELSAPIQGGTSTLVAKVVARVQQRDSSIDERIAAQSAEYVVSLVKKTENPYDPTLTATYKQMEGMTLLALATAQISVLAAGGGASNSYTAGLVSQKADVSAGGGSRDTIDWLIKQANKLLGLNLSFVMLLEDIDVTGLDTQTSVNYDQSRQAITINFE